MKRVQNFQQLYDNLMEVPDIDPWNRKNPNLLKVKDIFKGDKYESIFIEVSESEEYPAVAEYGLKRDKNSKESSIILSYLFYNNKVEDFNYDIQKIKIFKNIKQTDLKKIPNLIIKHYKKMNLPWFGVNSTCDYIALNSNFKWNLNVFSKLLKKPLFKRKKMYIESGTFYEDQEKYSKLDASTDPSIHNAGEMHPDIIIYYFNDKNKYKPIKKIKP